MRWMVAMLVIVMFAGCVDDKPVADSGSPAPEIPFSEKRFDILPVEQEFVTASDGTPMHNAVYRPDSNETVPVFINFSPYWGNTAETRGDNFGGYMIDEYVPRGYAVVLAAIRGTGHSGGCFEVASDREVLDLKEVIEHFAAKDWSNGHVAIGGKSYDSTPQNGLIAKHHVPALKGMFHVSGISDMYRYNYYEGVPYSNGLTFTPRYGLQFSIDGDHPEGMAGQIRDTVCPEMAEHAISGTGSAAVGNKDAYWQERDWVRHVSDSSWNGSIFFVHGLQDWNVKPDHILPWLEALPEQIRVRMWLHQDSYPGSGGHVYPMRTDWNHTMLAWLDHELKGYDNGFWQGPQYETESTDDSWWRFDTWPPAMQTKAASMGTVALEGATHISGRILVNVTVVPHSEDAIAAITLYDEGPGGREWIGGGVLRLLYRNGLDSPEPVVVGMPIQVTVPMWPMDHVVEEGHRLVFTLGQNPGRGIVMTTLQERSVTYDVAGTEFRIPVANATLIDPRPVDMECFAC